MNSISEFLGAIIQILVIMAIPFVYFIIKNKSRKGFFDFIGLKKSTKKANTLAILASLIFAFPLLLLTFCSEEFKLIMLDASSITGKFHQMDFGLNSMFLILIVAVFKTAFAEEILFRGFLAKRLINWLGYFKGNAIQAILFGAIHAAIFANATQNPLFLSIIFLVPSIGAYVSVYLNEKVGNHSIVPGWVSHGLANFLSYLIVVFLV